MIRRMIARARKRRSSARTYRPACSIGAVSTSSRSAAAPPPNAAIPGVHRRSPSIQASLDAIADVAPLVGQQQRTPSRGNSSSITDEAQSGKVAELGMPSDAVAADGNGGDRDCSTGRGRPRRLCLRRGPRRRENARRRRLLDLGAGIAWVPADTRRRGQDLRIAGRTVHPHDRRLGPSDRGRPPSQVGLGQGPPTTRGDGLRRPLAKGLTSSWAEPGGAERPQINLPSLE